MGTEDDNFLRLLLPPNEAGRRFCGIEVTERRIMPAELAGLSVCFITGSAAEVQPKGKAVAA